MEQGKREHGSLGPQTKDKILHEIPFFLFIAGLLAVEERDRPPRHHELTSSSLDFNKFAFISKVRLMKAWLTNQHHW